MQKQKVICDLIHGYIKIPQGVEKIMGTEQFQRLKYISQLTAQHLYPSANHTRFEHSLGVMHLAIRFYDTIKVSLNERINDRLKDIESSNQRSEENRLHLIAAALLHDVGHAPLSHVGEEFFPERDELIEYINEQLKKRNLSLLDSDITQGTKHEWMSCVVILVSVFYKMLEEIFASFNCKLDFNYIVRIITGNQYQKSKAASNFDRNIIISIVNSEYIDVDKLDYLMRDSFMTGRNSVNIDIEKLLLSLRVTREGTIKLGFSNSGLSAIQEVIDSRDCNYLWIANHHTVVYTDYLIAELIRHIDRLSLYNKKENCIDQPPKYISVRRCNESDIKKLCTYYDECDNSDEKTFKLKSGLTKKDNEDLTDLLYEIGLLPYIEAENWNKDDYFSINAIVLDKVTDHEIYSHLKRVKKLAHQGKLSNVTERLIKQLLDRHFLKPLWKTVPEYNQFVDEKLSVDSHFKENIVKDNDEGKDYRRRIVKILCDRTGCKIGEIFIAIRKNKFYIKLDKFPIYYDKHNEKGEIEEKSSALDDYFPQRKFNLIFDEMVFYIFCLQQSKENVRSEFIKLIYDEDNIYTLSDAIMKNE